MELIFFLSPHSKAQNELGGVSHPFVVRLQGWLDYYNASSCYKAGYAIFTKSSSDITLTYDYLFWNLKLVMLVISDSILKWVCIFLLSHLAFIILERTVFLID